MNRITELFERKAGKVLSVYFTAGYPCLDSTNQVIANLCDNGVDLIEIGFPFSDPLADGPVIQSASEQALRNGMSLPILFQQLAGIRENVQSPLVLMGYLNPVLQFGMEAFLQKAAECGIDGVIIPDLPFVEFKAHYMSLFKSYGIKMIFLITPQTSAERIRALDEESDSFIYMVTQDNTTGCNESFSSRHIDWFKFVRDLNLKNPVLAGFGIHDKAGFDKVCQYVNGAIIGSAFIKAIATNEPQSNSISTFINTFRDDHSVSR